MSDAAAQLESLHLTPQSLVIVRTGDGDGDGNMDIGRRIHDALRARGLRNLVIVLGDGAAVEMLDAGMMARHGWFRRAQKRRTGTDEREDARGV